MSALARRCPQKCLSRRMASVFLRPYNEESGRRLRAQNQRYSPAGSGRHYEKSGSRPRTGGTPLRVLSTLNARLLTAGDFINLSQRKHASIRFPESSGNGSLLRFSQAPEQAPFPRNCQGFLFYDSGIPGAPLSASVRFRVTTANNPASFFGGEDLALPSGFPWQISLPQVVGNAKVGLIREQLLRERLTTEEQLSHCRALGLNRRIVPQLTLYHLDSLFVVDFAAQLHLTIVGRSPYLLLMNHMFEESGPQGVYHPWTGTALARFERSTRPEHAGRRVLHMRMVKITQPVACTVKNYSGRVVQPREGELVTIYDRRYLDRSLPQPWTYDIDTKRTKIAACLRALWDISGLP
ncbi:hypothetical protein C8R43DRAFT_1032014 [Mycena crocata]|nr:hypothetical protein C8R43DRAFT_1032014 [Mycena crocata]